MFRFDFDFEETVQQTPTDCRQQEEARITPCEDRNGTVSVTLAEDNPETVRPFLPEQKQEKQDIMAYPGETEREMQAEIALLHGEAIVFIARYLQKHHGKTYWQAQGEAITIFAIMRETHIRQALAEGRDDAAERLLQEGREKFGMPDYLATSRTNWPESVSIH